MMPKPDLERSRMIGLLVVACVAVGMMPLLREPGIYQFAVTRLLTLLLASMQAGVIAAACAGIGFAALPRSALRLMTPAEQLPVAFLVGSGITSVLLLALGMAGWMHAGLLYLLLTAGILAGSFRLVLAVPRLGNAAPSVTGSSGPTFLCTLMGFLLGMAVFLLLVISFCPPLLFDITEYHLGALTDYLRGVPPGKIQPLAHNFYGRFPFPVESLYLLGLILGKTWDYAPKLLNAVFVLNCAGITALLVRRLSGQRSPATALAFLLVLVHPVTREVSLDAYIDAAAAAFVLGAVLVTTVLLVTTKEQEKFVPRPGSLLPLACWLWGMAFVSKYTNAQLWLVPAILLTAVPVILRRQQLELRPRHYVGAGVMLLLPAMAWLGKNAWFYGNPLEPFFQWVFQPGDADRMRREKFYIESHFPQSPLSLAYWTSLVPRMHHLCWILLAPVAGIGLLKPVPHLLRMVTSVLLVVCAWNLVRESQDRFLLAAICLLVVIGALVWQQMESLRFRAAWTFLLLFWVVSNETHQALKLGASHCFDYLGNFALVTPERKPGELPDDARTDYYKKNLPGLGDILPHITAQCNPDSEILMVFEARPYLVPANTVYNTVWDQDQLLRLSRGARNGVEVATKLKEAGITHVLVNRAELKRYIQQYARREQLDRLGVREGDDPGMAFFATPTPEDLYPPFYRDREWERLRRPVLEFLGAARTRAVAVTSTAPLEIYLSPL